VYLLVRRLAEVFVPESDGVERLGRHGTHDFVGLAQQRRARVARRDRHGDDDARRVTGGERFHRRPHRRAGGQAVIDEDHGAAGEIRIRAVAPVRALAPVQFREFPCRDAIDRAVVERQPADDVVVDHAHAAARDGAHGEFLVARHAEFADDEYVERRAERPGDLGGDRHAAARQAENDHVVAVSVLAQMAGKHPAGLAAIAESSRGDRGHAFTAS